MISVNIYFDDAFAKPEGGINQTLNKLVVQFLDSFEEAKR